MTWSLPIIDFIKQRGNLNMSEFDYNWIKFTDDVNQTLKTFSTPTLSIDGGSPFQIERSYGAQLKKNSFSGHEFRLYFKKQDDLGLGGLKYITLAEVNSINGISPRNYKYGLTERTIDWDSSEYNSYKM